MKGGLRRIPRTAAGEGWMETAGLDAKRFS